MIVYLVPKGQCLCMFFVSRPLKIDYLFCLLVLEFQCMIKNVTMVSTVTREAIQAAVARRLAKYVLDLESTNTGN